MARTALETRTPAAAEGTGRQAEDELAHISVLEGQSYRLALIVRQGHRLELDSVRIIQGASKPITRLHGDEVRRGASALRQLDASYIAGLERQSTEERAFEDDLLVDDLPAEHLMVAEARQVVAGQALREELEEILGHQAPEELEDLLATLLRRRTALSTLPAFSWDVELEDRRLDLGLL